MNKGKLNVDIAGSISALEEILKEFRMKKLIYKLFFRGRGLEFDSYRDFAPDDDAGRIDWKASARTQKLLVKQYIEERDLKIMFMIDIGDNMVFGSTEKIKCEFITEFVTAFSKVMLNSNDRVGFVLFSDKVTHFVDCKTGEKQLNLFIDTLSNGENYGGTTNLDMALNFALNYFNNSISSVILVSDFLRITSETEKKLGILSHRFETIAVRVRDPLDITLPNIEGEIILENPGANSQIIINPSVARKSYEKYAMEQGKIIEDIFKKSELDYLDLVTDTPFAIPLVIFLKERLGKR